MREDHLFYTTGKGLSSSKDDSKHTFVTQDKTAGRWLREKPGASVKRAPRCARIADRRYRRSRIPTQLDDSFIDAPGFPRRPVGPHRHPHLQLLSHLYAMIGMSANRGKTFAKR